MFCLSAQHRMIIVRNQQLFLTYAARDLCSLSFYPVEYNDGLNPVMTNPITSAEFVRRLDISGRVFLIAVTLAEIPQFERVSHLTSKTIGGFP